MRGVKFDLYGEENLWRTLVAIFLSRVVKDHYPNVRVLLEELVRHFRQLAWIEHPIGGGNGGSPGRRVRPVSEFSRTGEDMDRKVWTVVEIPTLDHRLLLCKQFGRLVEWHGQTKICILVPLSLFVKNKGFISFCYIYVNS